MSFLSNLASYIKSNTQDFDIIEQDRKDLLLSASQEIAKLRKEKSEILLTFICTHNSRRSMFGQVWAKIAAAYYDISNLATFSGGTEATAFNERAVAALERAGFFIEIEKEGDNPTYKVQYSESEAPLLGYSKVYDAPENPQQDFIAIMTCDHADANCPFIPGAYRRISLTYVDPKEADGTENEAKVYDERCQQIATEMFYLMSLLK